MNPVQILSACSLQSTDTVADFGAGSGFISRSAAGLVPQGNVFAVEINKDIVTRLTRDAADLHLKNLHPLWGDIETLGGSKLGDESTNFVILSNILFHLDDKTSCIKEAWRVLKPGGRMLLIDWSESFGGLGPAPHQVVPKAQALELATRTGFTMLSDNLPAGDHHYAILFKK